MTLWCIFMVYHTVVVRNKQSASLSHWFFGLGNVACFHCDDWDLVSGSYSYTQDSSLVIMVFMKSRSTVCGVQHVLWDSNMMLLLLRFQKIKYKLCCHSLHGQIFSHNRMCQKSADAHLFCNFSDSHTMVLHHYSIYSGNDLVILVCWWLTRGWLALHICVAIFKWVVTLFNLCKKAHSIVTESHLNLLNGFNLAIAEFLAKFDADALLQMRELHIYLPQMLPASNWHNRQAAKKFTHHTKL